MTDISQAYSTVFIFFIIMMSSDFNQSISRLSVATPVVICAPFILYRSIFKSHTNIVFRLSLEEPMMGAINESNGL